MRTLKSRLIISHILPLLIIVPLVGLALLYLLETQVLLADVAEQMQQQAALTAELAKEQPDIWNDANKAHVFVKRFSTFQRSQVMLLDPEGNPLASSNPAELEQVRQPLDLPELATPRTGDSRPPINLTQNVYTHVTEVWVPVVDANKEVVGIVRLSNQLSDVREQFLRIRYIIIGMLAIELLLGVVIGLVLALDLERSLRHVTQAIAGVAGGGDWTRLPEKGPEEIRQLLRAFNSMAERLQMLEAARRRLLANLVHELGRPIGALQAGIQTLLNGAAEETEIRQKLLEGMQAETRRLKPLLDNLVKLHDRVLGTVELNYEPTRLSEWLAYTAAPWRKAALEKGLAWQTSIPENLPTLEVDPDRLAQVVGNLLSNAVKYTSSGGAVGIEAGTTEDDGVWIKVSDTGPGIDPDEQERIFEPFHRSQRGRRFPQGMGLGLTIARDLVMAHGGRLEVESEPDRGSHFTVWLPPQAVSQTLFIPERKAG
ncbi:MAG: HAMP domain-containing sensor histidine kinase [Anaerolineae bacterium]|nr:HAMP domain-containing sensor histidine kinase [Anaerolineae bacterium]